MKAKNSIRALSLLLVMALAGAMFVPAVSAFNELKNNDSFKGDIVSKDLILKNNPYLFDDKGNKLSDKEISEKIERMPEVVYLDGMDKMKSKKISVQLEQLNQYRSNEEDFNLDKSTEGDFYQADSGIKLDSYTCNMINGNNHPGNMEVSIGGTEIHYLTSHIGKEIYGEATWIEVGVAKLSGSFEGWDPTEYVVFTYDSTAPEGEEFIVHQTFSSGYRNYNYEVYISPSETSEGYPYMLLWQGNVIRTGYLPFCYGDVDVNHEYFSFVPNSYTTVSESYFCDMYVDLSYIPNTLWWNDYLADTEEHLVGNSAGTPGLEYSVPWWSEAYQVISWMP